MPAKLKLKNKAVRLRNLGYSYNEILRVVKVSKSSLSIWLRNIELSNKLKSRLISNSNNAHLLGGEAQKIKNLIKSKKIKDDSVSEITNISNKDLMMLGAMLYWAEGSKQSARNKSQCVQFVNSDPAMCRFFVKWTNEILKVDSDRLKFSVYMNETKKHFKEDYLNLWSKEMNISKEKISLYFTKNKLSKSRRVNRENYKGQLRIVVNKSTFLNRKISGWIEGICLQAGVLT